MSETHRNNIKHKPRQDDREQWHGSLDRVGVGHRHLPDADMRRNGGRELAEGQRDDQLEVIFPGEVVFARPHAQEAQHGARVDGHRQQLHHRQRHRVRKVVLKMDGGF